MRQVTKVIYHGTYKVMCDEFAEEKPFRVIHEYNEYTNGRLKKHRQQKFKSDHLSECLEYIGNTVRMWEQVDNLV